jgi:hypothetical protein
MGLAGHQGRDVSVGGVCHVSARVKRVERESRRDGRKSCGRRR